MSIDVKKVARLARLRITDAEVSKLEKEFDNILGWISQLESCDTSGIEPMITTNDIAAPMREDEVKDGNKSDQILSNSPHRTGKFFTTPKVVD